MREYIIENKKTILFISIFIIILIILNIVVNLLGDTNKVLVNSYITKLNSNDLNIDLECEIDKILEYNNIPYFTLSNKVFDEINEEILEETLLRICYQDGYIDYETSLNNNILSLAINISHDTIDDLAYVEYKTYNINTNNNTRITNQDLLKIYNLTLNDVKNKVKGYLTNYYNYEKKNNYINNITFNEYLKLIEYEEITLNNMNLYVDKKNDLYIFKDYILTEGMSIDTNYPDLTIKFKLT
ncbi:MAG: hypothetical protein IJ501_00585 [Bacilli bacterium]|nr:hypothetical protein [Bacilli bacterium]